MSDASVIERPLASAMSAHQGSVIDTGDLKAMASANHYDSAAGM